MKRTHAGSLRASDADRQVSLSGWVGRRRDHGGWRFWICATPPASSRWSCIDEAAHDLRSEYCVTVTGTVRVMPGGKREPGTAHREVEVVAESVEVLSPAAPLPFPIDEHVEVGEDTRLRHRYLDLRRPARPALRMRSKVNQLARDVLLERDFVEVETRP